MGFFFGPLLCTLLRVFFVGDKYLCGDEMYLDSLAVVLVLAVAVVVLLLYDGRAAPVFAVGRATNFLLDTAGLVEGAVAAVVATVLSPPKDFLRPFRLVRQAALPDAFVDRLSSDEDTKSADRVAGSTVVDRVTVDDDRGLFAWRVRSNRFRRS